jgi:iron complex outermembrane receptor protein
VSWASQGLSLPARWYDHDALKTDLNLYFKHTRLSDHFSLFYDLQYRKVRYRIHGFRNNPGVFIDSHYDFFNPKIGFSINFKAQRIYASYAHGSKEPNRDDFETGVHEAPKPEHVNDFEVGYERKSRRLDLAAVLYYMRYKDQLILTGQINDVGAYTRTNVPESFRLGAELFATMKFNSWLKVDANVSVSRNKLTSFTEYIDDYDNGGQLQFEHVNSDIALSPSVIGGYTLHFMDLKGFDVLLNGRYTGKQYLDNTSNDARKLDEFYVQDVHLIYTIPKFLKKAQAFLRINNLFNQLYEPNGYTYSYKWGGTISTENYYFPMAGTNFMTGVNISF